MLRNTAILPVVRSNFLTSTSCADLVSSSSTFLSLSFLILYIIQLSHQHFHGQIFVFQLTSLLCAFDSNPSWFMEKIYSCLNFVNVLSTCSSGTHGAHFDIFGIYEGKNDVKMI